MRSLTAVLILATALHLSLNRVEAADTFTLTKFEVEGANRCSTADVLDLAGLEAGGTVTPESFQAAATRLMRTGLFSRVSYRYKTVDSSAELTFELQEADWSIPVLFDNFVWYSDDELTNALRFDYPFFDGRSPANGVFSEMLAASLANFLRGRGMGGDVEHVPTYTVTGALKEHILRIVGSRLKLCTIAFRGVKAVDEEELVRNSLSLFEQEYSRVFVQEHAAGTLVQIYRRHGHLRAAFKGLSQKPEDPRFCVGVTLEMEEGPRYRWHGVEWAGNNALGAPTLESALQVKSGDIADGWKIDAGLKAVGYEYGKIGHIEARVVAEFDYDDAESLVFCRARIDEGSQYRMGQVEIHGLPTEEVGRLKTKWKLEPGDVFNDAYPHQFIDKEVAPILVRMRLESQPVVGLKPNRASLTVDVNITFENR